MEWYNKPSVWEVKDDAIAVTSNGKTDFWRETHYGFIKDNGHFFYQQISGDFIVEVKVNGDYQDLYDQAGLMVRLDEFNWLKCGIEFVNGVQQVSAVVTRNYSDWSVVPMPHNPSAIWVRVTRRNTTVEVEYSLNGTEYTMLRLAYLSPVETVSVGVMCASPEGKGFPIKFEKFQIRSL
ncbi:DUF1349 domain-containing protein [Fortiea sp. LEGE XX443]|nr:DUF1349 domain-containing protein [Fortiea sp. LEGE XX443]MBE9004389.1 DUF1349 domain-containing protein [Fortiea sp. LEGE XX443]